MTDSLFRLQPSESRLRADLERLATFREESQPGWTRRAFSAEYVAAREWLRGQMEDAGLRTELDAAANLIGRRPGRRDDLDPIMVGSHIDTVVGGGRFDGTIGVLAGIEIMRCLREANIDLEHPFEVVDFFAVELSDCGLAPVGASAMGYPFREDRLAQQTGDGRTLGECIASVGGRPSEIRYDARREGSVAAFLELHVEQGPTLASEGVRLGVVTVLPGFAVRRVRVGGPISHGGVTVVPNRLVRPEVLTELATGLEAIWSDGSGTGAFGQVTVTSGGAGATAAETEISFEMLYRDEIDYQAVNKCEWATKRLLEQTAMRRRLELQKVGGWGVGRAVMSERVVAILEGVVGDLGLPARRLPSPGVHAANNLKHIAPVGMLFVPSAGGSSHCPDEWTDWDDVALGTKALGEAILRIDARLAGGERLLNYPEWTLIDADDVELGVFLVTGTDQPWFIGNFEAYPAFEKVRQSVEYAYAEIPHDASGVELTPPEWWRQRSERIRALKLRLVSKQRGLQYTDPFFRIEGRRARLRGLPDRR